MLSPKTYFDRIKDNQHVFIYAVAGRSSSTAFQRIINSSNSVWIWGEQHGIIDKTIALINLLKKYSEDNNVTTSLIMMYHSYRDNKHLHFYPNAIGNLNSTIDVINSSISNLLKPWDNGLKRFGFKDVGISARQTLDYLKEIFEQSQFLFCFRDPLMQWPSVHKAGWWLYSHDLNSFLDEYYRISNIYLEFASKNNIIAFIENIDLKNLSKVKNIMSYLNIGEFDASLIDVSVGSVNGNQVSDIEKEIIEKSNAYQNYLKMKSISESFYSYYDSI